MQSKQIKEFSLSTQPCSGDQEMDPQYLLEPVLHGSRSLLLIKATGDQSHQDKGRAEGDQQSHGHQMIIEEASSD